MRKRKIAIVVPAHNEEPVLATTLQSLLKFVKPQDLYVINDGSSDQTGKIARKHTKNVISRTKGGGKANALNTAIEKFKLIQKYEYIMPVDADTIVSPEFLKHALPLFEKDPEKKVACVIGKVVGQNHKWITSYRMWEYEIAQTIHKKAQSIINAVIVCPGPSTIFRSEIFTKVRIPTDTVTEDMDLTFAIHRLKLGKILYCDKAIVITQDPKTIKDFVKQVDRWYKGFWQAIVKHNIPWGGQRLDLEVAMLATEGLFNGLLVLSLIFLVPLSLLNQSPAFLVPIVLDLVLFLIPTLILTAKRHGSWNVFNFIPQFYFMRTLTSFLFLKSFIKIVWVEQLSGHTVWNTSRYEFGKEGKWSSLSAYSAAQRS